METTAIQDVFSSCKEYNKMVREHNIIPLRIQEAKQIIEMTKEALKRTPDDVALLIVLEQEEKELNELYESGSDGVGAHQFKVKKELTEEDFYKLKKLLKKFDDSFETS